jgi:hypothetical protein
MNRCDLSKFQVTPSFAGSFWWHPRTSDRDLKPGPLIKPTFFMLFIKCMVSQFIYNPTYMICETLIFDITTCFGPGAPSYVCHYSIDIRRIRQQTNQLPDMVYHRVLMLDESNTLIARRQLSKWGLYFDYWNHTSIILAGRLRHSVATIKTS